jgi:hypothetical protein
LEIHKNSILESRIETRLNEHMMLNMTYDITRNDKIAVELNNTTLKEEVFELKELVKSM